MRVNFKTGTFYIGDCLEIMPTFAAGSIDMILCDLPYGTTQNKWDVIIPFNRLWSCYWWVLKSNGLTALTATQPFSSILGTSQLDFLRYSWVWEKPHTGQLNVKRMPLKNIEDVLIFYKDQPTYNPQMVKGDPYTIKREGGSFNESYGAQREHTTVSNGDRYPMQILRFKDRSAKYVHPTQKPIALFEYLIRTYTNPGELVLDNTAGSGTTAIAAMQSGRRWICIEQNETYANAALARIWDAEAVL